MRISYTRRELKNTGNFENITFEISAEDEVITDCEADVHCYDRLKEFVDLEMSKLTASVNNVPANDEPSYSSVLQEVRESIAKLMGYGASNRNVIAKALSEYGYTKITELDELEIKEFNIKLKRLLR